MGNLDEKRNSNSGRREDRYYDDRRYGLDREQDFDRNNGQNYGQSYNQSYGRDYAEEPSEPTINDEAIHVDVREALFDHLDEEHDTLTVDVSEGIVTLAGTVRTQETKELAQKWASKIHGVVEVHNEILVSPELSEEAPRRRDSIRPEFRTE